MRRTAALLLLACTATLAVGAPAPVAASAVASAQAVAPAPVAPVLPAATAAPATPSPAVARAPGTAPITAPATAPGPVPAQRPTVTVSLRAYEAPPVGQANGSVRTDIAPNTDTKPSAGGNTTTPAGKAGLGAPVPAPSTVQSPTSGFPPIAAATAATAASTVLPSTSSPQAGATPGAAPDSPGPVKTYATLAAAAKDGVDPLKELKTTAPVAQPDASFDWANPASYLRFIQAHQDLLLKYAAMVAVAGLAAWLYVRKRA